MQTTQNQSGSSQSAPSSSQTRQSQPRSSQSAPSSSQSEPSSSRREPSTPQSEPGSSQGSSQSQPRSSQAVQTSSQSLPRQCSPTEPTDRDDILSISPIRRSKTSLPTIPLAANTVLLLPSNTSSMKRSATELEPDNIDPLATLESRRKHTPEELFGEAGSQESSLRALHTERQNSHLQQQVMQQSLILRQQELMGMMNPISVPVPSTSKR